MTGSTILTTILAYLLIIFFFVFIERGLRKGSLARSWKVGQHDRGSQAVLGVAWGITSLSLYIAPVLNYYQYLLIRPGLLIGIIGLMIMMIGIVIRYWAAKTLGVYYTRTLRIEGQHPVIKEGPYRVLRHPGYLGVMLLLIGAGIATTNWLPITVTPIAMFTGYFYRIHFEEKMLQSTLGQPYIDYMRQSWRLIPYIY
jgi:protein-S-isoprenylcysteine O-methyltransferase Ste14